MWRSTVVPAVASVLILFHTVQLLAMPVVGTAHSEVTSQRISPEERDGKWGYVDEHGQFVIPPQFDWAGPYFEGLAAIEVDHKFGYIDSKGRFVVQPKYFEAEPFHDGVALVCTHKPVAPLGRGEAGILVHATFTYVDSSGREILAPFSAEYVRSFSDGFAAVKPGAVLGGCGKGGYLNRRGEWAIKPQFDQVRDFSEGLAAVNSGGKCNAGGKWGYIDKDAQTVIPFRFDFAGQFKAGLACVKEGHQWKLVDLHGQEKTVDQQTCLADKNPPR
jgi:hypothetical protein